MRQTLCINLPFLLYYYLHSVVFIHNFQWSGNTIFWHDVRCVHFQWEIMKVYMMWWMVYLTHFQSWHQHLYTKLNILTTVTLIDDLQIGTNCIERWDLMEWSSKCLPFTINAECGDFYYCKIYPLYKRYNPSSWI